jgi:hypothetical protein
MHPSIMVPSFLSDIIEGPGRQMCVDRGESWRPRSRRNPSDEVLLFGTVLAVPRWEVVLRSHESFLL